MIEVTFYKEDWAVRDRPQAVYCPNFDAPFLDCCIRIQPEVVFVGREFLGSHGAILRRSAQARGEVTQHCFVNVSRKLRKIEEGAMINVDIDQRTFEYRGLTSDIDDPLTANVGEEFGWTRKMPGWRCDRPSRSYPAASHSLLVEAFQNAPGEFVTGRPEVRFDRFNRLWTLHYPSPQQLAGWIMSNRTLFWGQSLTFARVLLDLIEVCRAPDANHERDATRALQQYYRSVRLFSSTPTNVMRMLSESNRSEQAYISREFLVSSERGSTNDLNLAANKIKALVENQLDRSSVTSRDIPAVLFALSDLKRIVMDTCRIRSGHLNNLAPKRLCPKAKRQKIV